MSLGDRRTHWDGVYSARDVESLSWHQDEPRLSLELIRAAAGSEGGRIIDVGGGASLLVDRLLERPFERIAVLDLSEVALGKVKARLGELAKRVDWIVADVTQKPEVGVYDIWHDRAVFHFLTSAEDRKSYVELAHRSVRTGGRLIIAAFSPSGPKRCSGLEVERYDAAALASELGEGFALVSEARETHAAPSGSPQPFVYAVFRRI